MCCSVLFNGEVINSKDSYTHDPFPNSHTALETDALNTSWKELSAFDSSGAVERSGSVSDGRNSPAPLSQGQGVIPNLHCTPDNLHLISLLCLCLGKRKDSALSPKVQT